MNASVGLFKLSTFAERRILRTTHLLACVISNSEAHRLRTVFCFLVVIFARPEPFSNDRRLSPGRAAYTVGKATLGSCCAMLGAAP